MTLTYGSLFSGIGGLDLAVEEVFGATPIFHSEVDKNPAKVLATHWPGVPNLGDITEVDWTQVPPVDILCGGFPCQDISSAGARAGIKEGTRSGLWFRYADAIRVLRPRYVVVENVGALLVRGLDIVLGSLAEIGYDARWTCLRASDIGAPHQRNRLFLVAWDATSKGPQGSTRKGLQSEVFAARRDPSPDAEIPERGGPEQQALGTPPRSTPELGERPRASSDPSGERHGRGQDDRVVGLLGRGKEGQARERQRPREVPLDRGPEVAWGRYEPAIRRWERVLGRPAPAPALDGRLNPAFTEWMMGYPDGWVTDILPRNPALRACGNGVVTLQAVEAIRRLMAVQTSPNPSGESITVILDPNPIL